MMTKSKVLPETSLTSAKDCIVVSWWGIRYLLAEILHSELVNHEEWVMVSPERRSRAVDEIVITVVPDIIERTRGQATSKSIEGHSSGDPSHQNL